MEFNKEDLQDWISENHDKYHKSHFDIDDMFYIQEKWAWEIQHIKGDYFVRVFFIDKDNYHDYWDYPIEDYKAWLRDRQINKLLQ